MIFCVLVVGLFFTKDAWSVYLLSAETHKYFIKNITLFSGVKYNLPGVFADTPYQHAVNGSLWTLPYEVKMYAYLAIIGLLLMHVHKWLGRDFLKPVFLCMALVSIAARIGNHFQPIISDEFIRLFAMFFIGTAFYAFRDNIRLSSKPVFLVLVVLALSISHKDFFFVVYSIALPYLVFYMAYVPAGRIRRFNQVGDYSYGIYIYAFPVQQSIAATIPGVDLVTMVSLSFAVTLILSLLSWHLIEKKFLKMKGSYIVIESLLKNMAIKARSE